MRDVHHDTAMPSLQQAGNGARTGFSDKAVANPCTGVQGFGLHISRSSEVNGIGLALVEGQNTTPCRSPIYAALGLPNNLSYGLQDRFTGEHNILPSLDEPPLPNNPLLIDQEECPLWDSELDKRGIAG